MGKIIDEFKDVRDIIETNKLLKEWFIRNQYMILALGLTESDSQYTGECKDFEVLARMARALFSWVRCEGDKYSKDLLSKSAALAIANIYRNNCQYLSEKANPQQRLVYVEKVATR